MRANASGGQNASEIGSLPSGLRATGRAFVTLGASDYGPTPWLGTSLAGR
jgi:hypothetical protein